LRATTAIASTFALLAIFGSPAWAIGADTTSPTGAPTTAEQIALARAKAQDAAQRLADAEVDLAETTELLETTAVEAESARRDLERRQAELRDFSVEAYMGKSQLTELDTTAKSANDMARAEVLGRIVSTGAGNAIDEVLVAEAALEKAEEELAEKRSSEESALNSITAETEVLATELARLQVLEQQEREQAARLAREAAQRARAEEEARNRSTTTVPRTPPTTAPPGVPPTTPPAGPPTTSPPTTTPPTTTPPGPPPTTPPGPPPTTPPSGGWSVASDWLCPIAGTTTFVNTWGAPRSGGRTHQGTDMFAALGTPVVAPVSGRVEQRNGGLGGLAFFLYGNDGHTYYGAHLDTLAASGQVTRGTVLGTVGNTGNASGGAMHLHFEIHPNRGAPQNPFPVLRAHC
jgi:murein DD-endopeptidase MepM/ murein hydrolase activator NlpD